MPNHSNHSGTAALSICEALLLALSEAQILPEEEIIGLLQDAAATHENAGGTALEIENHKEVAALINRMIADINSAQRT